MKSVFAMLASVIVALSSSTANAQPFIQIDVAGTAEDTQTGTGFLPFGLRAIFDASAAPDGVFSNSIRFNAVWGEGLQVTGLLSTSIPFEASPDPLGYFPADVQLNYIQSIDSYQMSTILNGEPIIFKVDNPVGAFSLAMTSLPDAPGDYENNNGEVTIITENGFGVWNSNFSFGTIFVSVRIVEGPPEPECLADINKDGQLNFFDVSAYLQLFGNGCP